GRLHPLLHGDERAVQAPQVLAVLSFLHPLHVVALLRDEGSWRGVGILGHLTATPMRSFLACAGETAWRASIVGCDVRRRRIHLLISTTNANGRASAMHASHWGPVRGLVSMLCCRKSTRVASTTMPTGINPMAMALRTGAANPLPGSRRFDRALKTVPIPITAKVMVTEAVGTVVLGSSGPATNGISAPMKSTAA